MALTIRHGRKSIVWGRYERTRDGLARDAVHNDAVDAVATFTLRILRARPLAALATCGQQNSQGKCSARFRTTHCLESAKQTPCIFAIAILQRRAPQLKIL